MFCSDFTISLLEITVSLTGDSEAVIAGTDFSKLTSESTVSILPSSHNERESSISEFILASFVLGFAFNASPGLTMPS